MNTQHKYGQEQAVEAEAGVPHWKAQRRSALVLIPLSLWVLYSLIHHIGMDFDQARAWVAHPLVALLLIIFVSALFYHAKLGLQVIIEDYVSDISGRQAFIKIFNLICWMAGLVAIASILRIAFGS